MPTPRLPPTGWRHAAAIPLPRSSQQQYDAYVADLDRIATGHLKVPQSAESHAPGPSVTNFAVHLGEP